MPDVESVDITELSLCQNMYASPVQKGKANFVKFHNYIPKSDMQFPVNGNEGLKLYKEMICLYEQEYN